MARHLLTAKACENAKAGSKPIRLLDGDGLFLRVSTTGAKSWQFKYRLDGESQTFTIGKFPDLSLADARKRAEQCRNDVAKGVHLTEQKRTERVQRRADRRATFETVAADWMKDEARRMSWSKGHASQVEASLRNHVKALFPLPIKTITAPMVSPIFRTLEEKAPRMFAKVRPRVNAVFNYAVEHGVITANPMPGTRRRALGPQKHLAAITDLKGVGEILRKAATLDPCKGIARAHLLLAFTAKRPGEAVNASWSEFDLDAGLWTIARNRMKKKEVERGDHVIPLPPLLLGELKRWRAADAPDAVLVCPSPLNEEKPVTVEGLEKFYSRESGLGLKGKHSPHSWRSVLKTTCADAGKASDVTSSQLDHKVGNKVAQAYDRAKRVDLRRELLTWYEGLLTAARDGATVVPIRKSR